MQAMPMIITFGTNTILWDACTTSTPIPTPTRPAASKKPNTALTPPTTPTMIPAPAKMPTEAMTRAMATIKTGT